jgi:hypothetical protein
MKYLEYSLNDPSCSILTENQSFVNKFRLRYIFDKLRTLKIVTN